MSDKVLRSAQDAVRYADLTGPEEHRHIWVFKMDEGHEESGMFVCRVCGASRFPMPGETEMLVARELNIRHDGDGSDL